MNWTDEWTNGPNGCVDVPDFGHTKSLRNKIGQLTVALARSNMVKGGAGGHGGKVARDAAAAAGGGGAGGAGGKSMKAATAARLKFEEAAQANSSFNTFLRVGTGPSEMIDLTQWLPAPPEGSDPGAFIPSKPDLSASRPSTAAADAEQMPPPPPVPPSLSSSSSRNNVGGRETMRPSGAGGAAGAGVSRLGMGAGASRTGGGAGATESGSGGGRGGGAGAGAGGRGGGGGGGDAPEASPLRESRQQSRDKATLLRPVSTPHRVAADEAPLEALEVLLPDNREMYTEGEVTEWRLAHLAQMQALQEAFEERLQLCAEFWRGRYAVAVAAAEDHSSKSGSRGGGSGAGGSSGGGTSSRGLTSSGGGLHQPRSGTILGGAGEQVKIQALPFVYPKSQCWPRKGGSMGYFEEITGGGDEDENALPFGGGGGGGGSMRASTAPDGGGGARITGRGGGGVVSGKRHAVASPAASPEAGAVGGRSHGRSRSRIAPPPPPGATPGGLTSRHGGGGSYTHSHAHSLTFVFISSVIRARQRKRSKKNSRKNEVVHILTHAAYTFIYPLAFV